MKSLLIAVFLMTAGITIFQHPELVPGLCPYTEKELEGLRTNCPLG